MLFTTHPPLDEDSPSDSADRNPRFAPTPERIPIPRADRWAQWVRWSLVSLLSFELLIRLFIMQSPVVEYLPAWGIVPVEGASSLQGREGFAVTQYLAYGEVETPIRDSAASYSIVVLGDSTVQAAQVANDKNFVSLTETALRQKGQSVDLRNLGRSLQSVADHVYLAPAVTDAFSPDIVIVQVNPSNFRLSNLPDQENQFVDGGDGKLALVHREPEQAGNLKILNILNRSALYSYLDFRLRVILQDAGPSVGSQEAALSETGSPPGEGFAARVQAQAEALRDAYPSARVIFLVIPYSPTFSRQGGVKASWRSASDDELARVLSGVEGVLVLNAAGALRDLAQRYTAVPRGMFFNSAFNYGHLNEYGHIAVAEALTEALEQILR